MQRMMVMALCLNAGVFSMGDSQAESGSPETARAWRVSEPLLLPGPAGSFDEVAVKDPTVVYHGGLWHVFYTACAEDGYSIGYVAAGQLDGLQDAPRHALTQLGGKKDPYAAAPQVFFFAPQGTWYLVYQTRDSNYQPVYSTTKSVGAPESWPPPRALVVKEEKAKWIDFWVMCDETTAYLFYTRDHKAQYVMTTALDAFPEGFGEPREVYSPVHEAVHIYKAKGLGEYHMFYENRFEDDYRRFGLATAPALLGPWTNITPAYAAKEQLRYPAGAEVWTEEVSHGEMLRTGCDQYLEYDPARPRFLIQGLRREKHQGEYHRLEWSLGLIEAQTEEAER